MGFRENRLDVFKKYCPPLYFNTDLALLSQQSRDIIATPYPKDGNGVMLVGKTRTGKTRTAWMLAREWFCSADRSLIWFNGGSFGRAVADNYGNHRAEEWHKELYEVPILLLDDIFKHRLTDAVQDALFSVVEDRMAYLRPTLLTLNNDGGGLSGAVSADMVAPLLERLMESCRVFRFAKDGQPEA